MMESINKLHDCFADVTGRLGVIEFQLKALLGNGSEGRCSRHGREIAAIKRIAYVAVGGGTVILFFKSEWFSIIKKLAGG